jgi:hypothetical protein
VDRVVGLDEVRVEIEFVRTSDGYGRLELTKFHNPMATTAEPHAPANTFTTRRSPILMHLFSTAHDLGVPVTTDADGLLWAGWAAEADLTDPFAVIADADVLGVPFVSVVRPNGRRCAPDL